MSDVLEGFGPEEDLEVVLAALRRIAEHRERETELVGDRDEAVRTALAHGWSQRGLAEVLGVSPGRIWQWQSQTYRSPKEQP